MTKDSPVVAATEAPRGPLQVARRQQLLAALQRDGAMRISDLSDVLGAAPVTIRRDIAQLAAEGLVRRVHGGVALILPDDAPAADEAPAAGLDPLVGRALGMLVPSLDYYWPDVARGVEEAARELDMRVVLRGSSYDTEDDQPATGPHGGADGRRRADHRAEHGRTDRRAHHRVARPGRRPGRPAGTHRHGRQPPRGHGVGGHRPRARRGHGGASPHLARTPQGRPRARRQQPHQPARAARLARRHDRVRPRLGRDGGGRGARRTVTRAGRRAQRRPRPVPGDRDDGAAGARRRRGDRAGAALRGAAPRPFPATCPSWRTTTRSPACSARR